MLIDPKNIPELEDVVDRVKHDILHYGIATFNRYFPSSFDGLIPAIRRVLFVCYQHNITSSFMKVSKLGGLVAAYHPHGDLSINETITKMAQDGITINHALLEPSGNFGSISNLDAAAARYISTRISKFGWDAVVSLMDDYSMEMIESEADWGDREPMFIPSKIPLVLVIGRFGIAESFMVDVQQHNLSDVVDRVVKYIKNKKVTPFEIADGFFPDFVTGGIVVNGDEITKHYYDTATEGSAVVRVRGDAEIDNSNNKIIIRSVPISLDFDTIRAEIKDLMNEKDSSGNPKNLILASITYVGEARDNLKSNPYIYITCKNGTNLVEVLDNLYKYTRLENSKKISLNMNYNGKIKKSNIKEIIEDWYAANYIVRRRKIIHDINVLQIKVHILEGLLKVYPNIDAVIQLIKTSTDVKEIIVNKLKTKFGLTLIQAKGIYEMQLGSLTRRSESELNNNIKQIKEKVAVLTHNLTRIDDIMIEDALEIKKNYGRPRRTKIISRLKERTDVVISNGAILATRNNIGLFDSSNIISGKKILNGFKGIKINSEWVKEIINSHRIDNNISSIAVFYENGVVNLINPSSNVNCWIPVNVEENGYIKAVCPIYKDRNGSIMCILSDGSLKRFETDSLTNRTSNTTTIIENCIYIPENHEDNSIIFVNDEGEYLNIKVSDVPVKGRTSQGVLSSFKSGRNVHMALSENDSSHYVILLQSLKLNEGYVYTQLISDLKIMSRTNKLKKLYQFPDFKCNGVSIVDLNIKDQLGLFISEDSTSSLKIINLKNLKAPRKINLKAFNFIGIEVS